MNEHTLRLFKFNIEYIINSKILLKFILFEKKALKYKKYER